MHKSLLFLGCFSAIGIAVTTFTNFSLAQSTPPGSPGSATPPPSGSKFPGSIPPGFPGTPSPKNPTAKPVSVVLEKFSCQTRGGIIPVSIKSDRTYKSGSNPFPATTGTYQKVGAAYRFKNGTLKDQSILQLRSQYYLVATAKEARAGYIAATDGAAVCTRAR